MRNMMPIIYYIYAAILVGGGVMGSMVSHKPSSILGSLAFGAVAVTAGVLTNNNPRAGLALGLVDALAVTAFFIYRYNVTHKAMPAFPSIGLSLIVAVLTGVALAGLGKSTTP